MGQIDTKDSLSAIPNKDYSKVIDIWLKDFWLL